MSIAALMASVTGTESDDLNLGNVEVTVEAVAEAVVDKELAEVETELAVQDKEIDGIEKDIEILEEKVEELEEEIAGMEAMLAGGEFNAALFQDKYSRAAKLAARFGAPVAELAGTECADTSSAQLNAFAGIESFKDTAKKAGGAIKKFFVDLYNGFINWFVGLFNKMKGLETKAKGLSAKVSGKEPKEKVNFPASASWLGGKAVDVTGSLAKVVAAGDTAAKAAFAADALKAVQTAVSALKELGTASQEKTTSDTETFKVKVGEGHFTVVYPHTVAGLGSVSVSAMSGGEAKKDQAPLTKGAIGAMLSGVQSQAKTLQFSKLDSKALTAQRDSTIAILERMAKEDNVDIAKSVAGIKAAVRAILKLQKGGQSLAADLLAAQLAAVNACF